jgi:histidyl-tRNA synthetase
MAETPSIPKGTRDFSPDEVVKRNYIFNIIEDVFRLYGFQPIETPAMENLSTLTGKYGEEGDRLLFKILNSGDYLKNVPEKFLLERNSVRITPSVSEKGLRYDLTVPFARFVAQYRNDIVFPFRRYQIQPVWRADRPQKGRYREFYQCDADIIGSNSILNEAELIQIINDVFNRLKIKTTIKYNNRKILAGIAEIIGEPDKINEITVTIDKLEKTGLENVNRELAARGVSGEAISKLQPLLAMKGDCLSKTEKLERLLASSEIGIKGIDEIKTLYRYINQTGLQNLVEFDQSLARGLDYYTGAIFEVKSEDVNIGSICGGGRYDDLTGIFGLPGVSGVGISFGAERIYEVIEQLNLFPEKYSESTKVMFINFGEKEEEYSLPLLTKVRKSGINAEIYPEWAKIKKQMNYANKKKIPFVILAGENEIKSDKLTLKNMGTGEQKLVTPDELIKILSDLFMV